MEDKLTLNSNLLAPISFKSWGRDEFALELESLRDKEIKSLSDKEQESLRIEFNDVVLKNIEVFFEVLSKSNVSKIIFVTVNGYEFDMICFSIAKKFFELNFAKLSAKYTFVFEGLTDEFVINKLIGQRNYFIYCNMKNVTTKWNDWLLGKERELVEKYSSMEKYAEFKLLKSEFEKNPFSSFNFPQEKGVDRFVYYYYVYDKYSQNTLIDYMTKTGFNSKYIDTVKKTPFNVPVMGFGLGFSYKEQKVIRRTLYISFYNPFDTDSQKEYFKKTIDLDLDKFKFNNIWYGGVDDYKTHEEIKVYEESNLFVNILEDTELGNILRGKVSTHVLKFKENSLVDEKFEFNLKRNFKDNEIEILIKKGLITKEHKILAIYLKDGKIVKSALYEL